jgi:hypothetical protein
MIKNNFSATFSWFGISCLLVLLSSVSCFSEPAAGKSWEFYGRSKGGSSYYYNKATMPESSDITTVWSYKTITDQERKEKIESIKKYNTEESIKYHQYDYSMSRIEIDCKKRLNRVKEIISYDKEGKILEQGIFNNEWESIAAQSMADSLYQKICVAEKKTDMKKSDRMSTKIKSAEIESSKTKKTDKHDWVQYGRPLNGSVYAYDKASINYKGNNLVRVWRKLTYSDEHREKDIQKLVKSGLYTKEQLEKLSYDLTLHEIDCRDKRSRLINIICYDRYDNVLLKRSNNDSKWKQIIPESQEDLLQKQVCK